MSYEADITDRPEAMLTVLLPICLAPFGMSWLSGGSQTVLIGGVWELVAVVRPHFSGPSGFTVDFRICPVGWARGRQQGPSSLESNKWPDSWQFAAFALTKTPPFMGTESQPSQTHESTVNPDGPLFLGYCRAGPHTRRSRWVDEELLR